MKRKLLWLAMGLLASNLCFAADLDSRIQYRADKVKQNLGYAEDYLKKNQSKYAAQYLESAEFEMQQIFDYYQGKFDENHPTIVSHQQRIKALKEQLGTPASAKPAAIEPAKTETAVVEKLPSSFQYEVDKTQKNLQITRQQLANNQAMRAKSSLENLEATFRQKLEWNKNKVSPDHPDVVAILQEILALKAQVESSLAASGNATKGIQPVADAIDQLFPLLKTAVSEGRMALLGLSSVEADYSIYRDVAKIQSALESLQAKTDRINALLPNAQQLVHAFKAQFPDQNAILAVLPETGYELYGKVASLEGQIGSWLSDRDRVLQKLATDANDSIPQAKTILASAQPDNPAMVSYATGNAQMWAVNYFGNIIDAVDVAYPESNADTPEALQLSETGMAIRQQAATFRQGLIALQTDIAKLKKETFAAGEAKIKAARFPVNTSPIGTDEAEVSRVLTEKFASKPIRLAVYAPWETRTEARWINDHWDVGTFKYLGVWMAKQTVSGHYRVYRVTLRNRQQPDGSWGALHYWSIGNSYEILKENIEK